MDSVFVMSESGEYGKSDSLCFFPGSAMYRVSLFIMCLVYGFMWTNIIKSFCFVNFVICVFFFLFCFCLVGLCFIVKFAMDLV